LPNPKNGVLWGSQERHILPAYQVKEIKFKMTHLGWCNQSRLDKFAFYPTKTNSVCITREQFLSAQCDSQKYDPFLQILHMFQNSKNKNFLSLLQKPKATKVLFKEELLRWIKGGNSQKQRELGNVEIPPKRTSNT